MAKDNILQDSVNEVCEFLEITPIVVDEKQDTLDSLTRKVDDEISKNNSTFARGIVKISERYELLKTGNILDVLIKYARGPDSAIDDDMLGTLFPMKIKKLHVLLGSLSHGYCADNCHITEHKYHCCEGNSYSLGFKDPNILYLQQVESKLSGKMRINNSYGGCDYLNTQSGCTLTISKSPACIGFLCGELQSYLRKKAPSNMEDFVSVMLDVMNPEEGKVSQEKIQVLDQAALLAGLVIDEIDCRK